MFKKIILLIIVSGFIQHCGFSPLHSVKATNINFSINEISFEGDKIINNYLKSNLNQYKNNKYKKKFNIKAVTTYSKVSTSKDKTGKITNYELSSQSIFDIIRGDKIIKQVVINQSKNMNNIDDKFEEQKYERSIKQTFASSISSKLTTELSLINDN